MFAKFGSTLLLIGLLIGMPHCSPPERTAYTTVTGAKAFLDSVKLAHPECSLVGASSVLCADLARATAAKDSLIDAVIVYCSGPQFNSGGACTPPRKNSPVYSQVLQKMNAAVSSYQQAAADLKGVL
jgi:hypothetical protein